MEGLQQLKTAAVPELDGWRLKNTAWTDESEFLLKGAGDPEFGINSWIHGQNLLCVNSIIADGGEVP